jgi:hypothetical protein
LFDSLFEKHKDMTRELWDVAGLKKPKTNSLKLPDIKRYKTKKFDERRDSEKQKP